MSLEAFSLYSHTAATAFGSKQGIDSHVYASDNRNLIIAQSCPCCGSGCPSALKCSNSMLCHLYYFIYRQPVTIYCRKQYYYQYIILLITLMLPFCMDLPFVIHVPTNSAFCKRSEQFYTECLHLYLIWYM